MFGNLKLPGLHASHVLWSILSKKFFSPSALHERLVTNINYSPARQIAVFMRHFSQHLLRIIIRTGFVTSCFCHLVESKMFGSMSKTRAAPGFWIQGLTSVKQSAEKLLASKHRLHLCRYLCPILLRLVWTPATLGKVQVFSSSNLHDYETGKISACVGDYLNTPSDCLPRNGSHKQVLREWRDLLLPGLSTSIQAVLIVAGSVIVSSL